MNYVAENTTIPIPRVYEVDRDDNGNAVKIHMDYMAGETLEDAWATMTDDQKRGVAEDLRDYVIQLRALKGDYIGAAGRGEAIVGNYVFHEGGPFDTEADFNEFLFSWISPKAPHTLRYHVKNAFRTDHEIVFTHGDLAPRNIMVNEGRVTAILDWENAGWYPEYWEYERTYRNWNDVPGWMDYIEIFLPLKYSKEIVASSYLTSLSR